MQGFDFPYFKTLHLLLMIGVENKVKQEVGINKPGMLRKKLIAQPDIIQGNSMVESANKLLKYELFIQSRLQILMS